MWSWFRLFLAWINKQPRELRLMFKSGIWLIGSLIFAVLVVPVFAGLFAALSGGGAFGFMFSWGIAFGIALKVVAPLLIVVIGLPWLLLLLPVLLVSFAVGPLALLNWTMGFITPIILQMRDWRAFKTEFQKLLESDPSIQAERIEQGSARFALPAELSSIPGGPISLGQFAGGSFLWDTPKHVLIIASSRSGKGRSLLVPNLLIYPGGVVVVDPKGENAELTARRRRQLNGDSRVFVLDPWGISGEPAASFNPFDRLRDPEQLVTEAAALASALVIGEEGDHWIDSARGLLKGLVMHVATAASEEGRRDLPRVREILTETLKETLEAMKESPFAGGLIRRSAMTVLAKEEKEQSSIISTAITQTEFLDAPQMIAALRPQEGGPKLNMSALLDDPISVFLCLPAPLMPAYNRWLRLVITSALTEMTMKLNPPDLRVQFHLDELATLGHLEAVENAVGLAAGYGLQIWAVFQDVPQMKDTYKTRWASFVGNSGVTCVFAVNDYETAKYVSDMLGTSTIESRSESRDRMGNTTSASAGTTSRPLQTPDEVLRLDRGKMYVLLDGRRPVIVDRVNYDQNRALAGMWGTEPQPWKEPELVPVVPGQTQAQPASMSDEEFSALFDSLGPKKSSQGDASKRP